MAKFHTKIVHQQTFWPEDLAMIAVKVNIVTPKHLQTQGLVRCYAHPTAYVTTEAAATPAEAAVQPPETAAYHV